MTRCCLAFVEFLDWGIDFRMLLMFSNDVVFVQAGSRGGCWFSKGVVVEGLRHRGGCLKAFSCGSSFADLL